MIARGKASLAFLLTVLVSWVCSSLSIVAQEKPKVDALGDPLPEGALARIGTERLRHPGGVSQLSFSTDKKLLASLGNDVRIWDVTTGRLQALIEDGKKNSAIAFLPASHNLLLAKKERGTPYLSVWDTEQAREIRTLEVPLGVAISSLAVSGDGRYAAAADNERLLVWNLAEGTLACRLKSDYGTTFGLAFSPDAKLLAHAVGRNVNLFDVAQQRLMQTAPGASSVAFGADGRKLFLATHTQAHVWDIEKNAIVASEKIVSTYMCSYTGWSLEGSAVHVIRERPKLYLQARGERTQLGELWDCSAWAFSSDGTLMAAAERNRIAIFDLSKRRELHDFGDNGGTCLDFAFAPNLDLVASLYQGKFLRRAQDGKVDVFNRGTNGGFAIAPDQDAYAYSGGQFVEIRRLTDQKQVDLIQVGNFSPHDLKFSPDGTYLAGVNDDGHLAILETRKWNKQIILDLGWETRGLAFSPDGASLAVAVAHKSPAAITRDITIWDLPRGELRLALDFSNRCVRPFFVGQGNFLVADFWEGSSWKRIWWNLYSGEVIRQEPKLKNRAFAVAPNDMVTATAGNGGTLVITESLSGKPIKTLPAPSAGAGHLGFGPHGRYLGSLQYDGTILLWDWLPSPTKEWLAKPIEELWDRLKDDEAPQAYRAVAALLERGDRAVAFFDTNMSRLRHPNYAALQKWTQQLADPQFEKRMEAYQKLFEAGKDAEIPLRDCKLPADNRQAMTLRNKLLAQIPMEFTDPELLRFFRVVQLLEYIGNDAASSVLKRIARGVPHAPATEAARLALVRLEQRASAEKRP